MNTSVWKACIALLALAGCERSATAPNVRIANAWVRLPAAPGGEAAGYFEADANRPGEVLTAVSSPGARVEMHESMTMNRMSKMEPIANAPFEGDRLAFAPGARHLMIFGLDPKLKPGGFIPLTLRFKSAPPATVDAKLVAAGAPAPDDAG
jgi:copper(I)-binding protein